MKIKTKEYESTKTLIDSIRNEYKLKGYIFVPWNIIKKILLELWVQENELLNLQQSWDFLAPDPTMPRLSRNGRFLIDLDHHVISRLEQISFTLDEKDWFKRKDAGLERKFSWIESDLQSNPAFQALLNLQTYVTRDVPLPIFYDLQNDSNLQLSTVFQIRTIRTQELNKDIYAWEPAPEGAHCDIWPEKWHIATIYINWKNLREDSAVSNLLKFNKDNFSTIVWTKRNEVQANDLLAECQHKDFLDTLFFIDRPHTVSPIFQKRESEITTRDMILLMTRKIKNNESIEIHPETPKSWEI